MINLELDPFCREHLLGAGFDLSGVEKCPLKILLVSDRADFDDGNRLHLSELLDAMTEESPFLDITVVTAAHHSCDVGCDGAQIQDLDFSAHDLSGYDQIWLFGVKDKGQRLPKPEVDAIVRFMQSGGGVFAVGDHGTHGQPLCGGIPRVRSMRRWSVCEKPLAPDMGSRLIDTVVGDEVFDAIPQTILPRVYRSPYDWAGAPRSSPHPVLCGPLGPISALPDHKHEGLVEVPEDLSAKYKIGMDEIPDYPHLDGKPLVAPQVIAKALNQHDGSCFGAIGVFDGHLLKPQLGRVAVDSTWHHFVNFNLNQFRCHHLAVIAALERGATPDSRHLKAAEQYIQMRAYFRNLTRWLARPETQLCLWWRVLCALRGHTSILMVLRSSKPDNPLPYFLDLGVKARQALRGLGLDLEFWSLSRHVGEAAGLGSLIAPFAHQIDSDVGNARARKVFSVVDPELVASAGVGGALHHLGRMSESGTAEPRVAEEGFEELREGVAEAIGSVLYNAQEGMGELHGLI